MIHELEALGKRLWGKNTIQAQNQTINFFETIIYLEQSSQITSLLLLFHKIFTKKMHFIISFHFHL